MVKIMNDYFVLLANTKACNAVVKETKEFVQRNGDLTRAHNVRQSRLGAETRTGIVARAALGRLNFYSH